MNGVSGRDCRLGRANKQPKEDRPVLNINFNDSGVEGNGRSTKSSSPEHFNVYVTSSPFRVEGGGRRSLTLTQE